MEGVHLTALALLVLFGSNWVGQMYYAERTELDPRTQNTPRGFSAELSHSKTIFLRGIRTQCSFLCMVNCSSTVPDSPT